MSSRSNGSAVQHTRRTRVRRFGVLVAIVGSLGGAAFSASVLRGAGANSPVGAAQLLFESIARGDAIGVFESFVPPERDVLVDSMVPALRQLARLRVLDSELDLRSVDGVSASVDRFSATASLLPGRPDLAEVTVRQGTVSTRIDPTRFPLGAVLRDAIGDTLDRPTTATQATTVASQIDATPLIVKKVSGRWYVSLGYTLAERARRAVPIGERVAVPSESDGVPAVGASTPEGAVQVFLEALADLDIRKMIEMIPADEFGPLQEYADVFLPDLEGSLARTRELYELSLPDLTLSSRERGDEADVTIEFSGVNFALTDPEGPPVIAQYRSNCLTLTIDTSTNKRCGADIATFADELGVPIDPEKLRDELRLQSKRRETSLRANVGFAVVRRDGAWFVSPSRTVIGDVTEVLRTLTPEDFQDLRARVERQIDSMRGAR